MSGFGNNFARPIGPVAEEADESGGEVEAYIPEAEAVGEVGGYPELGTDSVHKKSSVSISEAEGENPYFKTLPAKDVSSYPTRAKVLEMIRKIMPKFSVEDGFNGYTPTKNGEVYYYLAEDYGKELMKWLMEDDDIPTEKDLTVDNSSLFELHSKTHLRTNVLHRAIVIPKDAWNLLMELFGGGPQVCLTFKKTKRHVAELSGKLLRVICSDDLDHYTRFFLHPSTKISEAKKEICDYFKADPSKCRLHDFYKLKPFSRLDDGAVVKTELKDRQLMPDNFVLLELADEDGKFHIVHHNGRVEVLTDHMVPSANGSPYPNGVVGLKNLGNTCYMNSILQCLSNVPLLKDEFISGRYEKDINEDNALGYKGKMAKAYANLAKVMWGGGGVVCGPNGFRRELCEAKTDFRGYEQHDSQEFLSELLDALHEDLNRVKKKPATETVQKNGRPDDIVAAEALATHKLRHDSLISDLFTGLYKSTVSCPDESCGNVSVTFDPFMVLQLPLQSAEMPYHNLNILYVPMDPRQQPQKIQVIAPKHGPAFLLKEIIKKKVGINDVNRENRDIIAQGGTPTVTADEVVLKAQYYNDSDIPFATKHDLLLCRAERSKILDLYSNSTPLSTISSSSVVTAYECYDINSLERRYNRPEKNWARDLCANVKYKPQQLLKKTAVEDKLQSDSEDDDFLEQHHDMDDRPMEDNDEEVIGISDCPLLVGDVWFGSYNYNEITQKIRIEVSKVEKCEYKKYTKLQQENDKSIGFDHHTMKLSREEFESSDVYFIQGFADTKDKPSQAYYNGYRSETAFEVLGVYVKSNSLKAPEGQAVNRLLNNRATNKSTKDIKAGDDKGSDKKSQGSSFVEKNIREEKGDEVKKKDVGTKSTGKKTFNFLNFGYTSSKKKDSKPTKDNIRTIKTVPNVEAPPILVSPSTKTEKPPVIKSNSEIDSKESVEEEEKSLDELREGSVEKEFTSGSLFLLPGKRSIYSNASYSYRYQEDESREPIVLGGSIDLSGKMLWGKYRVETGFTKGEFCLQKMFSRNWKDWLDHQVANDVVATSRFSLMEPSEDRILVVLAHKKVKSYVFDSIPEAFFIPEDSANLDVCEIVKAKFQAYLEHILTDKEQIDKILKSVVIKRSNSRYDVHMYNHYANEKYQQQMVLDDKSDQLFKKNTRDTPFAWIVCDWPEGVPFAESRSSKSLEFKPDDSTKMNLSKALDLFTMTEKLNANNEWYCGKCKQHKQAFKQLQIWSLPTVLVIQFKRFSQEEGRSTADKLEIPVDFPFEIDLKEHALSYHMLASDSEKDPAETIAATNDLLKEYEYSLIGVSSHVGGGLGFGHYIACAKNELDNKWYEFNDNMVTPIKENWSRVVNPEAYVLFYVRKSVLDQRAKA